MACNFKSLNRLKFIYTYRGLKLGLKTTLAPTTKDPPDKTINVVEYKDLQHLFTKKYLTGYEMKNVEKSLIGKRYYNSLSNKWLQIEDRSVALFILQCCDRFDATEVGFKYFKHLTDSGIKIASAEKKVLFNLVAKDRDLCNNNCEYLYEQYFQMKSSFDVMDYYTLRSCVLLVCALDNHWREAIDLIEDKKSELTENVDEIKQLVSAAAFRHNEPDLGWELLASSKKEYRNGNGNENLILSLSAYIEYLQNLVMSGKFSVEKLNQLFEYMQQKQIHLSNNNFEFFKKLKILIDLLNDKYEKDYIWKIDQSVAERETGHCPSCNKNLNKTVLDSKSFNELRSAFLNDVLIGKDINIKSSHAEAKKFYKFLCSSPHFDVVLDGLNIAYKSNSKSFFERIHFLQYYINYFQSKNQHVLLLGRYHMLKWPNFKDIQKLCSVFLFTNVTDDDAYLIYAAMFKGIKTCIGTGDFLRGKTNYFTDQKLTEIFELWQKTHQYGIMIEGSHKKVVPPIKHEIFTHRIYSAKEPVDAEEINWHIACAPKEFSITGYNFEATLHWICLQRLPRHQAKLESLKNDKNSNPVVQPFFVEDIEESGTGNASSDLLLHHKMKLFASSSPNDINVSKNELESGKLNETRESGELEESNGRHIWKKTSTRALNNLNLGLNIERSDDSNFTNDTGIWKSVSSIEINNFIFPDVNPESSNEVTNGLEKSPNNLEKTDVENSSCLNTLRTSQVDTLLLPNSDPDLNPSKYIFSSRKFDARSSSHSYRSRNFPQNGGKKETSYNVFSETNNPKWLANKFDNTPDSKCLSEGIFGERSYGKNHDLNSFRASNTVENENNILNNRFNFNRKGNKHRLSEQEFRRRDSPKVSFSTSKENFKKSSTSDNVKTNDQFTLKSKSFVSSFKNSYEVKNESVGSFSPITTKENDMKQNQTQNKSETAEEKALKLPVENSNHSSKAETKMLNEEEMTETGRDVFSHDVLNPKALEKISQPNSEPKKFVSSFKKSYKAKDAETEHSGGVSKKNKYGLAGEKSNDISKILFHQQVRHLSSFKKSYIVKDTACNIKKPTVKSFDVSPPTQLNWTPQAWTSDAELNPDLSRASENANNTKPSAGSENIFVIDAEEDDYLTKNLERILVQGLEREEKINASLENPDTDLVSSVSFWNLQHLNVEESRLYRIADEILYKTSTKVQKENSNQNSWTESNADRNLGEKNVIHSLNKTLEEGVYQKKFLDRFRDSSKLESVISQNVNTVLPSDDKKCISENTRSSPFKLLEEVQNSSLKSSEEVAEIDSKSISEKSNMRTVSDQQDEKLNIYDQLLGGIYKKKTLVKKNEKTQFESTFIKSLMDVDKNLESKPENKSYEENKQVPIQENDLCQVILDKLAFSKPKVNARETSENPAHDVSLKATAQENLLSSENINAIKGAEVATEVIEKIYRSRYLDSKKSSSFRSSFKKSYIDKGTDQNHLIKMSNESRINSKVLKSSPKSSDEFKKLNPVEIQNPIESVESLSSNESETKHFTTDQLYNEILKTFSKEIKSSGDKELNEQKFDDEYMQKLKNSSNDPVELEEEKMKPLKRSALQLLSESLEQREREKSIETGQLEEKPLNKINVKNNVKNNLNDLNSLLLNSNMYQEESSLAGEKDSNELFDRNISGHSEYKDRCQNFSIFENEVSEPYSNHNGERNIFGNDSEIDFIVSREKFSAVESFKTKPTDEKEVKNNSDDEFVNFFNKNDKKNVFEVAEKGIAKSSKTSNTKLFRSNKKVPIYLDFLDTSKTEINLGIEPTVEKNVELKNDECNLLGNLETDHDLSMTSHFDRFNNLDLNLDNGTEEKESYVKIETEEDFPTFDCSLENNLLKDHDVLSEIPRASRTDFLKLNWCLSHEEIDKILSVFSKKPLKDKGSNEIESEIFGVPFKFKDHKHLNIVPDKSSNKMKRKGFTILKSNEEEVNTLSNASEATGLHMQAQAKELQAETTLSQKLECGLQKFSGENVKRSADNNMILSNELDEFSPEKKNDELRFEEASIMECYRSDNSESTETYNRIFPTEVEIGNIIKFNSVSEDVSLKENNSKMKIKVPNSKSSGKLQSSFKHSREFTEEYPWWKYPDIKISDRLVTKYAQPFNNFGNFSRNFEDKFKAEMDDEINVDESFLPNASRKPVDSYNFDNLDSGAKCFTNKSIRLEDVNFQDFFSLEKDSSNKINKHVKYERKT